MAILWVLLPAGVVALFTFLPMARENRPEWGGMSLLEIMHPPLVVMTVVLITLHIAASDISSYREVGYLRTLAASPANTADLLIARGVLTAAIQTVAVAIAVVLPFAVDVPWNGSVIGAMAAYACLALSIFGLALAIATIAPTAQGSLTLNMVAVLTLTLLSGVWVPRQIMPDLLRMASDASPAGAGSQAFADVLLHGQLPRLGDLGVLLGWAAGTTLIALLVLRHRRV